MSFQLLWWTLTLSTLLVTSSSRELEDLEGYQVIEDFSEYYAKYSTCFKVKIQENDDDQVEGNSYFYNNKYHAQYKTYAAFRLCEENTCTEGTADDSIGYVTELGDYLQENVEFVGEYCNACAAQCGRRSLEEAEDENEEEGMVVDCDVCPNQCTMFSDADDDEEYDFGCVEAEGEYDDDGIAYFQGPACEDGKIIIGLFYDEDCTVITKKESGVETMDNTFTIVQGICAPCDADDEFCESLYEDSVPCDGATPLQDGDDNSVMCKRYYNNVRAITYSGRKKDLHFWGPVLTCFFLLFGCGFCTQAYYLRHRNDRLNEKKIPLREFDHGESGYGQDRTTTKPEVNLT